MIERCAFTGHRKETEKLDAALLDRVILNLIKDGVKDFLCGMALGFDLIAAENVIKYKKDFPIRLIGCLPCGDQSERFSKVDEERYNEILSRCDEILVLTPSYRNGCMQERDKFMVDNCDVLVCFLRKRSGGTYYTVEYAEKQGIKIIKL